ncbi:GGDEF domain-containing protein [Pararhizobium qamdonense]|uniref:GGDEF domain-containing protein n=1 Tax=Pararhizobium qamdonense TaxID=3031126 RepID=UPI0023E09DA8|nr:GGDEF domain-containing protein [Pararhizobium qamdonense]
MEEQPIPASGKSAGSLPPKPVARLSAFTTEEVERQLGGRTRDIRLNIELSRLLRERTWPQMSKIIRAWMIWVIVLDVLTLCLNAFLLPAGTVMSMLLPASILPPAAVTVAVVFREQRARWLQATVLLVGVFFILVSVALVGVATGGEFYERHLTIMLFVAVTAIVIFPVPLRWAMVIGAYAIGIYLLFQLRNPDIELGSAVAGTLFFASGIGATLVARRTATILAHKTFLLELRDRSRLTDLSDANARLELLARTDPLTGVANRRSMMETLDDCWQEAGNSGGAAILMCDIDDFKCLNDSLGHAEGDRGLVKVAGIIQSSLRDDRDHVARYGGEEFLILLSGAGKHAAYAVAETIRKRVEAASLPNPLSRVMPNITVSIGLATTKRCKSISAEHLQRQADEALYSAKAQGRNQVVAHADSE